jgi:ABC-type glycerol-3-phosphate transport system substrate-binding protein
MRLKQWTLWGMAVLLFVSVSVSYMMNMKQSASTSGDSARGTAISIWVYSPILEKYIGEFQQTYPKVALDVRYFRSSELLFRELMASISANAMPQIVEMHSYFGISQLVDTGLVVPFNKANRPEWSQFEPSFSAPFHYREQDWAVPIGGGLPLLYYRQELLSNTLAQRFSTWDEVDKAASQLQSQGNESIGRMPWGIGVDKELPWYIDNLSFASSGNETDVHQQVFTALSKWKDWIHLTGIMNPLVHHRAASDFINGKTGLFISSSEMLPTIERYVGGKFQFDAGLLPVLAQQGIVPEVHGMVLLKSEPDKVSAAESFISYMLLEKTQDSLWRTEGLIPSRTDVLLKLKEEGIWSLRQKTILDSARMFVMKAPSTLDFKRWMEMQALIEQIELSREVDLNKKVQEIYGIRQ